MPVLYRGTAIVPAPLITVSEQVQETGDGTKLGNVYTLTLHGTITAVPPGQGMVEAHALGLILAQQNSLVSLFGTNGGLFEVYSPDGTSVTQCNPTVKSVEFAEGIWVQKCDYTIVLETTKFYPSDISQPYNITEASDNWSIEENGVTADIATGDIKPVWKLTHTLSAKGRSKYDVTGALTNAGWQEARDWVVARTATSNFAGRPFNTAGEIPVVATQPYSQSRVEAVDELEGSFSLTETWTLAYDQPAVEDYTISVRRTPDDSQSQTSVTVAGTIRGLYSGINQVQDRIANAISYYDTVKDLFVVRAQEAAPQADLSDFGVAGSEDFNYAEGTIAYSFEYNDRLSSPDHLTYDNYTVSRKSSLDAAEITVTVSGTVTGRLKFDESNVNLLKWTRALTRWNTIYGGTTIADRAALSGVPGLQPSAVNGSTDYNPQEGTVTYSYDFTNRLNDLARNEYTVSTKFNREDRRTSVTVDGTITGLRQHDTDPYLTKYNNAVDFWNTWQSQVFSVASAFVPGINFNPKGIERSRGDNQFAGTITYSFSFDNSKPTLIPGALFETINEEDVRSTDVFASIPVLGTLIGTDTIAFADKLPPVLQDVGARKSAGRSLSIEAVMDFGYDKPDTDFIITMYTPSVRFFTDRDDEQWSDNTGRYSRNVTWIFN